MWQKTATQKLIMTLLMMISLRKTKYYYRYMPWQIKGRDLAGFIPLILSKKEITEVGKAGRASKTKLSPLNSGLDLPLHTTSHHCYYFVAFCKKIFVSHVLNIPYCHNLVKVTSYHKTAPAPITHQWYIYCMFFYPPPLMCTKNDGPPPPVLYDQSLTKKPANSPFLSSPKPLHQSEAWCTSINMKMSLICKWMKSHFHMKGWVLRLALRKRFKEIQKWPKYLKSLF